MQPQIMQYDNQKGEFLLLVVDKLLCWNVRCINNTKKHLDVKQYIHKLYVGILSLLETKVKAANLGSLY